MRGSSTWRRQTWGAPCDTSKMDVVYLPTVGKAYIDRRTYQAFRMLDWVMRSHGYAVRPGVSGTFNCRQITGGTTPSSHSWATSWDVNWDTNPYRTDKLVTDMPREMVEEAEAIRTMGGAPVWRWGGDWDGRPDTGHSNYDAMHWEIIATPAELAQGIEFPTFYLRRPERAPLLARGDRGAAVVILQTLLQVSPQDGIFGGNTDVSLRAYQASRKLTVDGLAGPGVWTALLSCQPETGPAPVKPK